MLFQSRASRVMSACELWTHHTLLSLDFKAYEREIELLKLLDGHRMRVFDQLESLPNLKTPSLRHHLYPIFNFIFFQCISASCDAELG